jgi:hypothetical protein
MRCPGSVKTSPVETYRTLMIEARTLMTEARTLIPGAPDVNASRLYTSIPNTHAPESAKPNLVHPWVQEVTVGSVFVRAIEPGVPLAAASGNADRCAH